MTNALRVLGCIATLLTTVQSRADPAFASYAGSSAATTLDGGRGALGININLSYVTPGGEQPVTSLSLPNLVTGPQTSSNGLTSVSGSATAVGSIANGALHGATDASATGIATCITGLNGYCTSATAGSSVYELWIDHLTVSAPVGISAVQISYTTFFDGNSLLVGDPISSAAGQSMASFYSNVQNNLQQTNPQEVFSHVITGTGTFQDAVTHTMTVTPGVPFEIEEQLSLQSLAGTPYNVSFSEINAINTGGLYFTVLTRGATLTSASGETYDAPITAAVPEPKSFFLLLVGLLVTALRPGREILAIESACKKLPSMVANQWMRQAGRIKQPQ